MIGADLARALDPSRIATDVGLTLDPWQRDLMRSTVKRVLILASRQVGKTTVTALIAVATAVLKGGALILILSPSQRQSGEMFRTVMRYLKDLDGAPNIAAESALRCELENGSRICALPSSEATIRGFSAVDLIIVDEAARVPDELFAAARPMLETSSGRMIMLSTPAGRRGAFFEHWTDEHNDWHKVRVTASDCPRISQEFLDSELRELGQKQFESEYGLIFHDDDEAMVSNDAIMGAFTSEVTPLWE
jgi:phage terminase large subunit-like protein